MSYDMSRTIVGQPERDAQRGVSTYSNPSAPATNINYPNVPQSSRQLDEQQQKERQYYDRSTNLEQTQPFIYPSAWSDNNDKPRIEMTSNLIELSISCVDLPNADIITKSDPQVIVYQLDSGKNGKPCEIGRTEMISDNLNPKFAKKILMQYHFEQVQYLRFEVIDIDPIGGNDFLGRLDTTLAEIVTSRSNTFKMPLKDGPRKRPGQLIVEVEELIICKQVISFNMSANDLDSSFCGLLKPTATVHLFRGNENGTFTIVHRSQPVFGNCNPQFKPFHQKLLTLCNGDLDRAIRFEIVDERWNLNRSLGFFETTVNSLKQSSRRNNEALVFDLLSSEASGKKGHQPNGSSIKKQSKAILRDFKLMNQATFLDYIRAGAEIHFVIAIDFTASNGDPSLYNSLHYLDPQGRNLNPYEASLLAVGNILKPYDTKNMFAGFGFGAKLDGPNRPPNHLFPLNGNPHHPYVSSVEELLHVYRRKMSDVILSGPTNFAPCIQHCNTIARQFDDGNHYFVLLIVTDGIISDMSQTKLAIVEASKSPLSIIICGVGNADFEAMQELDSDDQVLLANGRAAERDIVQFVPMNQYLPAHSTAIKSPQVLQLLTEEVLREVPDQLTGYMVSHGFHPELTYVQE